jgi:hypothetical protein
MKKYKMYFIDKNRTLTSSERAKEFKEGVPYQFDTFVKVYPEYFIEIKEPEPTSTVIIECGSSIYDETDVEINFNKTYKEKEEI